MNWEDQQPRELALLWLVNLIFADAPFDLLVFVILFSHKSGITYYSM